MMSRSLKVITYYSGMDRRNREKVESGEMEIRLVRTKAMAADQLIENVGLQVLVAGKDLMGMAKC